MMRIDGCDSLREEPFFLQSLFISLRDAPESAFFFFTPAASPSLGI